MSARSMADIFHSTVYLPLIRLMLFLRDSVRSKQMPMLCWHKKYEGDGPLNHVLIKNAAFTSSMFACAFCQGSDMAVAFKSVRRTISHCIALDIQWQMECGGVGSSSRRLRR